MTTSAETQRQALLVRRWELQSHIGALQDRLVPPHAYAQLSEELLQLELALNGSETGQAVYDALLPRCKELTRAIAHAVGELGLALRAAAEFADSVGPADGATSEMIACLRIQAIGDPRNPGNMLTQWTQDAERVGLLRRGMDGWD